MEIFENSYKFFLSVGAGEEISRLCPDENLSNIGALFKGVDMNTFINNLSKVACIMSRAYEDRMALCNAGYKKNVLTDEIVRLMSSEEFEELNTEVMAAFFEDKKTSIKTKPKKVEGEEQA